VLRGAPWQGVIFSFGIYFVAYALWNAGLTDQFAILLDRIAAGSMWGAVFVTGISAAVLSSVMNNMPTVLVGGALHGVMKRRLTTCRCRLAGWVIPRAAARSPSCRSRRDRSRSTASTPCASWAD
jgi:Na+/H+ antiporter NhaD/arsenite permease-like protein